MLCKEPPNFDCDRKEIIGRIISNKMKYTLPGDVSENAKKMIKCFLQPDQRIRPSAIDALKMDYFESARQNSWCQSVTIVETPL